MRSIAAHGAARQTNVCRRANQHGWVRSGVRTPHPVPAGGSGVGRRGPRGSRFGLFGHRFSSEFARAHAGYGYPPAVPVSDNENQDNNCELQDNCASQIMSGVFHLAIHREVTGHEIYFSGKSKLPNIYFTHIQDIFIRNHAYRKQSRFQYGRVHLVLRRPLALRLLNGQSDAARRQHGLAAQQGRR